jgi:hypothetical protein
MTQTQNEQEIEAFLKGKPISAEFLTQLSTRVEALVKGLEASTQDLSRPGAGSCSQRPANNRKD